MNVMQVILGINFLRQNSNKFAFRYPKKILRTNVIVALETSILRLNIESCVCAGKTEKQTFWRTNE